MPSATPSTSGVVVSASHIPAKQTIRIPGEVLAPPADAETYNKYRAQDDLRSPYRLPEEYVQNILPPLSGGPETPLIVFINARSGGGAGSQLADILTQAVGRTQVFDLSEHKPNMVLSKLWENFNAASAAGNEGAHVYQSRLRILVAGGDGTIAWVLSVIKDLNLQPPPPVAIIPLGTGNDLSRSLNWGGSFLSHWVDGRKNMYQSLLRIAASEVCDLDCWNAKISWPEKVLVPPKVPHSFMKLPSSRDASVVAASSSYFWNYFSVGMDARAAHMFHSLREEKPYLTVGQLTNKFWYSWFSCTSGWFCCSKPLMAKVRLEIQKPGSDEWHEVQISSNIKALVVLNLQSYAGGSNLWGSETSERRTKMGWKEPSFSDGLLEVVGLGNGFSSAFVVGTKGQLGAHAERICQASGIRMKLSTTVARPDGEPSHAYLQIDGEPWVQSIPSSGEPVVVEISGRGQSKVLKNEARLVKTAPLSRIKQLHAPVPESSEDSSIKALHITGLQLPTLPLPTPPLVHITPATANTSSADT